MSVLVTGATGFIGGRLRVRLVASGESAFALVRRASQAVGERAGSLDDPTVLAVACAGIDTVFHCAGFAHAWSDRDPAVVAQHWRVNFEGTRHLVEAAGRVGVRRFVYLSSVKAMGEPGADCVDEDWPLPPLTPYGRAKRAAEDAILDAGVRYGMHVVNLRLAMVYGPGGRGNLERMARLVRRGWLPPLPETGNRRSLVYVDDVVAALRLAAECASAAGRTYIVAHPQAHSGRALYDALRAAAGLAPYGGTVSAGMLRAAARVGDFAGQLLARRMPFNSEVLDKLLGNACYSPARIQCELGWQAATPLAEGLRRMLQLT